MKRGLGVGRPLPDTLCLAYRLLLGCEPKDPQVTESYPETSRLAIVDRFISFPEILANGVGSAGPRSGAT